MKPEIACFQPEGCRSCLVKGKYFLKTETGIFCCIKHPRKLDVNIVELINKVADCPDEEKADVSFLAIILTASVAVVLLFAFMALLLYVVRSRRTRRHVRFQNSTETIPLNNLGRTADRYSSFETDLDRAQEIIDAYRASRPSVPETTGDNLPPPPSAEQLASSEL